MALQVCADCSAAFAVGLSACPQCGSTNWSEEGPMPKVTVHGGPSNDALASEEGPAVTDLPDGDTVQPAPEEESSPGISSETSSTKPQSSDEPAKPSRRSRARTTANPS